MTNVRNNLRKLEEAHRTNSLVRFVYSARSTGELLPKVGTVRELGDYSLVLNDLFHGGAARNCILERIVGKVEVQ